jgi:hypothetical protein
MRNMLDALDRLYDRRSSVAEVHALCYATAQALRADVLFPLLEEAADRLEAILKSQVQTTVAGDQALIATDALRKELASLLP